MTEFWKKPRLTTWWSRTFTTLHGKQIKKKSKSKKGNFQCRMRTKVTINKTRVIRGSFKSNKRKNSCSLRRSKEEILFRSLIICKYTFRTRVTKVTIKSDLNFALFFAHYFYRLIFFHRWFFNFIFHLHFTWLWAVILNFWNKELFLQDLFRSF